MIRSILAFFLCLTMAVAAVTVPRPSPGFVVHMTPSGQVTPEQHKGKVVILTFILTTCPHCQRMTGILNGLQKEYGPKGLQVMSAAFNDMSHMVVGDFIKQYQPVFPVGYATRLEVLTFLGHSAMEQLYVPTLIFIDRKGVIRYQYLGDDPFFQKAENIVEKNIRVHIEDLLKEPTSAKKAAPTAKKKAS